MAFTEPPPKPPQPDVRLITVDGKQTQATVEYLKRLTEWLVRLAAAVP